MRLPGKTIFFFFKGVNKLCEYWGRESKGSWLKITGVAVTNDTSAYTTYLETSSQAPAGKVPPHGIRTLPVEVRTFWDILTRQIPSFISLGSNGFNGVLLCFFSPWTWGCFWDTSLMSSWLFLLSAPLSMGIIEKDWGQELFWKLPKHSGIFETKQSDSC